MGQTTFLIIANPAGLPVYVCVCASARTQAYMLVITNRVFKSAKHFSENLKVYGKNNLKWMAPLQTKVHFVNITEDC
jgi:hypothetical protein